MKKKSLAQYRNELTKFTEREAYLTQHIEDLKAGRIEGNPKTISKNIKEETAELYRVKNKLKVIKEEIKNSELEGVE